MSSISVFGLHDKPDYNKLNIDDLYERNRQENLKQIACYNKILNRIHTQIRIENKTSQIMWYTVPTQIYGEAVYELRQCIPYVFVKLEEDGFRVRFMPPNILEISWAHWIPTYMRNEIFKKTGVKVDCNGRVISTPEDIAAEEAKREEAAASARQEKRKQTYTSTKDYRPTGDLVYNPAIFDRLEKKLGKS
jgi:hypothetical protein